MIGQNLPIEGVASKRAIRKIQNFLMMYYLGFSVINKKSTNNIKIPILGAGSVARK